MKFWVWTRMLTVFMVLPFVCESIGIGGSSENQVDVLTGKSR
jgi:hypothetical protein